MKPRLNVLAGDGTKPGREVPEEPGLVDGEEGGIRHQAVEVHVLAQQVGNALAVEQAFGPIEQPLPSTSMYS